MHTTKTANNNFTLAGFLITFTGAVLFSTKAIIVKLAFAKTPLDALTLLTMRMVFSLPFYLVAAWIGSSDKTKTKFTRREWVQIISLGLFGYYLSSLFDFIGLQYISAGLERLILFLYPTFAVLINFSLFKQSVSRIQWIALLLTYAGIVIAYISEMQVDFDNPNFIWGSLLIFLCSITFSIYIVGSGRFIPSVGATRFTAYAMLASSFGVFVHFAFAGNVQNIQLAGQYWWYGILLAVAATVLPSF